MKLNVKRNNNLNANKPPGIFYLPAWPLKDGCNELYPHPTILMNKFIKHNFIPTGLKRAIVTPEDKKDNSENAENYRPISITGALSEVIEKLLYKQIKEN